MEITQTVYCPTRATWRAWLRRHHATKREIWLIYYKKGSGKPRVEYNDAVEEALCYGWIDSTVKSMDGDRYAQRFTPRRPGSNWSLPNLQRAKRLVATGLMTPAGAAHLPSAREARAHGAAGARRRMRRRDVKLATPRDLGAALTATPAAAALWTSLAPGYKRLILGWIANAKRTETRARRIRVTTEKLARGIKQPYL